MKKSLLLILCSAFVSSASFARDKNDRVHLKNGDVVQGEIKELSEGSLTLKTDSAGTIYVDWVDVLRMTSTFAYELELKSGERLIGTLPEASADGKIAVSGAAGSKEDDIREVVGIRPIGASWTTRMDSDVSLGFSFTRSTDLTDLTFGAGTVYNGPTWKTTARLDSAFTAQGKSNTDSQRHTFNLQPQRYFGRLWYLFALTGLENNSELDLDARLTFAAGPGIRALSTQIQYLSFQVGGVFNEEWYGANAGGQSSAEGIVAATYSIFKRKSPKTSLDLEAQYFPGLSHTGRSRINGNARLRQEAITDLFIELSSFVTYDSEPQVPGVTATDTGITTSIGYTF